MSFYTLFTKIKKSKPYLGNSARKRIIVAFEKLLKARQQYNLVLETKSLEKYG
ncbi:hypothetical protein T190115A13A_160002 [Tenacibaculum sp. 190524A02b]|uniref:Uncharacterized protein n=1 Tax=Tenacibaculum vairaonense TaxID=3137860 RepID=A0ABP1FAR0_9FLAO